MQIGKERKEEKAEEWKKNFPIYLPLHIVDK